MAQVYINGKSVGLTGDEYMPLFWFLRESLTLTVTKFGCGIGLVALSQFTYWQARRTS